MTRRAVSAVTNSNVTCLRLRATRDSRSSSRRRCGNWGARFMQPSTKYSSSAYSRYTALTPFVPLRNERIEIRIHNGFPFLVEAINQHEVPAYCEQRRSCARSYPDQLSISGTQENIWIPLHSDSKVLFPTLLQWSAVTVTPSGICKSVTVTDCHSNSSFLRALK